LSAALPLVLPAAIVAAAAVPLRRLALRLRLLDQPGPRKMQAGPVPYLGGAAVLLGILAGGALHNGGAPLLAVLAGAFAVGLVDDLRGLGPGPKLLAQVGLAAAVVGSGLSLRLTHLAALDAVLTAVWLVGVANAFNLLDNVDGLCASVAAVASLGLALLAPAAGWIALPLAGAAAGFLVYNLPPARMYLGDAGSLTIGFASGAATVLAANTVGGAASLLLLVLPVAVAVFDTSLVIASRTLAGRPIQVGGLDHASHRLLRAGWDLRLVLLIAGAAAALGPLAAWAWSRYPRPVAWLAAPILAAFAVAWLLLLRVDPYRPGEGGGRVHG
jgi:UDP-GlcNAc:undecaprenyl-phosphate GlcNAc-1-phosphate transferase